MNKIIQISNLNKTYGDISPTVALKNINLEINEGEITAIIGQSGSGKTTLLNMIGLLDTPTNGNITINGQDVRNLTNDQRAEFRNEVMGFVFQFHYLLPEFSVIENVKMPCWIRCGKTRSQDDKWADTLIDLVGLKEEANKLSTKISGGQRQRTAIARALMNKPKIILADEPTGNLDTKNSDNIYEIFKKINHDLKTTFVIITHSEEIAKRANRIIEIKDGEIKSDSKKY
ncbi:ABC transporter ATP-binding protein [Candidatus Woesebacteria bacterium]|nr:MAG: ABC transporter ATP-binding protein [Candidatus Woesebacteria bacterium]